MAAQVNKLLIDGNFDLIFVDRTGSAARSGGNGQLQQEYLCGNQVVPEGINKKSFCGCSLWHMERMMGHADTPVRRIFNYASDHFAGHLPIVYVQTVVGLDKTDGKVKCRGLFVGDDYSVFDKAAKLALEVNFDLLDRPLKKVVVYLDQLRV